MYKGKKSNFKSASYNAYNRVSKKKKSKETKS